MKKRKVLILILIIVFIALLVAGSSYAFWIWESQQNTNVSFTLTRDFSCSGDGGGNITSNDIELQPTSCTDTSHAIVRKIDVSVINNTNRNINLELWLNVNNLDSQLADSDNFKWAIGTSPSSCTNNVITSGNFKHKTMGDKVYLTSVYSDWGIPNATYYLYIWLDSEEEDAETAGRSFNFSLDGECSNGNMPNKPFVEDTGLIPVKISDSGDEVYAINKDDSEWYDYANKKWANAVLTTSSNRSTYQNVANGNQVQISTNEILAYYVWIPRYSYKVWQYSGVASTNNDREIEIKFVSPNVKELASENGDWYTHPAFTFGDTELSGIWVGKFETSHNTLSGTTTLNNLGCTGSSCSNYTGLRILPSQVALTYNNVSNFFYAGLSMNQLNNPFGLDKDYVNSHMIKNSEWGAVAYLSHSRYGKVGDIELNTYQRNSNLTGCGSPGLYNCSNQYGAVSTGIYPQSTTGNVTGIFDMSGGMIEYMMGNFNDNIGSSGFVSLPDEKYYDKYSNPPFVANNGETNISTCNLLVCGGHALNETRTWYTDNAIFFKSNETRYVWLIRGRYYGFLLELVYLL